MTADDFRDRINHPSIQRQTITIELRVWQKTCSALAEAEAENVRLRRELRTWADLHEKNGWVDAEAVADALKGADDDR